MSLVSNLLKTLMGDNNIPIKCNPTKLLQVKTCDAVG